MAEGIGGAFLEFMPTLAKNALSKFSADAGSAGRDAGKSLGDNFNKSVTATMKSVDAPNLTSKFGAAGRAAGTAFSKQVNAALGAVKNKLNVDVEVDTRGAREQLRDLADDMNNTAEEGRLLKGALAALGPGLVPVLAVGVGAVAGLGAAIGAAALPLGIFGAAVKTTFEEFKSQQEKIDTLKGKLANLDAEIAKYKALGQDTSKLEKEKTKLLEKMNAEYAKLPEGSRAAFDSFEKLKGSWQDFIKANGSQVYGTMQRVFDTLTTSIGKLQPLMDIGAKAADALARKFEGFVNGGGLDKFVQYIAKNAPDAISNLGKIFSNLGTVMTNVFKNFMPTGQGFLKWLAEATGKLAQWSAGNGMTKFVEYMNSNGGKVASLLGDIAKAAVNISQAVAPLAPISLAVAQALAKIIAAIPQPVLTALVASFVAYRTAVAATTAVAKSAAVASALWAGVQGKNTTANATNTASIVANRVALVAHAAATKAATIASAALNVVMRANPIAIVVTAIAALVAALVLLYNKNETVRKIIDTVWAAIKKAMAATIDWFVKTAWPALQKAWDAMKPAVEAVGKAIGVAWDAIKKAIEVAWNAIKVIFSAIVSTLQSGPMRTAFDAYKAYLQVLWTAISTIIKNAWEIIKGVFTIIVSFLKGDFKGAWEALKEMIANVWKNIQTAIQTAWNAIKNTVFGDIIRYLGGQIKSAWDTLKSAIETAWNAIRTVISTVWGAIKTILDGAASFLRTVFGPVFTWLRDNIVKPVWEGIKLAIQIAWVAIQIIFKTFEIAIKALGLLMQWLRDTVVKPVWEAIKTIISTVWNAIKTTVFDAWQTYIKGPFTAMWNAFKTFLETLWNAIKTFLITTWNAIKTGVFIVWENYIKGPFTLMWNTFKTFFTTLWNTLKTFLMTTWTAIKTTIFDVWSAYIKGPFTAMWNAFKAFFTTLWNAIKTFLMQTWTAIKTTIFDVWSNYIKGPFTAMWNAFKSFLQTLWNAIKTLISAAWTAIRGTFNSVIEFLKGTFTNAWNTFKNTVNTVWNNIKTILGNAWNWIKTNVFNPIGTFLTSTLPGFFSKGVSAIGTAWEKLRDVAKKPVEFVVNTIIRDGIVKGFNAVASKVGVSPIQFGGMALGGVVPNVSAAAGGRGMSRGFATGGVLPGYTPGRDVHRFVSRTGGTLDLSGGEAVMRPEFTRAVGPKAIDSINAAARSGGVAGVAKALGLARGGIIGKPIGDNVGGKIKSVASTVWESITGIANPITGIVNSLIGKIPASGWMLDLMKKTVTTLVSGVGKTITSWVGGGGGSSAGGGATPGTDGSPGNWHSMWNWVKERFPSAQLYSGYRNSRTLSGNLSLHASGRAIDITPNRAISDAIIRTFGKNITELISPWPSDHYHHGRKHTYSRAVQAQHGVFGNNAHIHWAMKLGGILKRIGVFDDGGWLTSGGVAMNLSRKPEAVLTPEESAGLKAMGVDELADLLRELIDAVENVAPGVGSYIRGSGRGLVAGGRSI